MGYKLVCDKCGAPINPVSSRIVIGYNMNSWDEPEAMTVKQRRHMMAVLGRYMRKLQKQSNKTK